MNERPHLGEAPIRGSTPRSGDDFRPDIQGLRGIAVLIVALGHARVAGMSGGYVGVDVFFVISGFLITGWLVGRTLESGRVPFGDFYASRARRILPAAVLTLTVTCAASVAFLNPVRAALALHDAVWAGFFSANIHFASVRTDYFAQDDLPSPIQHFWTSRRRGAVLRCLAAPVGSSAAGPAHPPTRRRRLARRAGRGCRVGRRNVPRLVDLHHRRESLQRVFLRACSGVGARSRCAHRSRPTVDPAGARRPSCRAHLGRPCRNRCRDCDVREWDSVPRLCGFATRRLQPDSSSPVALGKHPAPALPSSWAASRSGSSATSPTPSISGIGRCSSSLLSTPGTPSRPSRMSRSSQLRSS